MFLSLLASILIFTYLTGATDSANVVAPVISSRALSPHKALWLTALAVTIAPFLFGVAVAHTIGAGLLAPGSVTLPMVLAATLSAILWRLITWWLGLPASSSHALVGGLVGAALAQTGTPALQTAGLIKVIAALFFSPLVGLAVGYLVTRLVYFLAQWATPKINRAFQLGEILTALTLALSWGANDAQKTIGLLALGMAAAHGSAFVIEPWMTLLSMCLVALGTLTGGMRLIRTLGMRFYKIRPVHGLAAQIAAAGVIFGAAAVGGPVSTTQVVSAALLGAGAADRVNQIRWGLAGEIAWAWLLTLPATMLMGAGLVWVLR